MTAAFGIIIAIVLLNAAVLVALQIYADDRRQRSLELADELGDCSDLRQYEATRREFNTLADQIRDNVK